MPKRTLLLLLIIHWCIYIFHLYAQLFAREPLRRKISRTFQYARSEKWITICVRRKKLSRRIDDKSCLKQDWDVTNSDSILSATTCNVTLEQKLHPYIKMCNYSHVSHIWAVLHWFSNALSFISNVFPSIIFEYS